MTNVIALDCYRSPNDEPPDLLDPRLDLTPEFLRIMYIFVKECPDDWDRHDIRRHIEAAFEAAEKQDNEQRRRDQNDSMNHELPMFDNRSALDTALIEAHLEYEQCARALARAREVLLAEKDKVSRRHLKPRFVP
ncbi:hypothetical protein GOA57_05210 [Sinorhizobium meliloti]|nr:hypothetical protein [Sinorhizobium meliloti]